MSFGDMMLVWTVERRRPAGKRGMISTSGEHKAILYDSCCPGQSVCQG